MQAGAGGAIPGFVGADQSTDVFVSYKREERPRVEPLVRALRRLGLQVWFDAALEAGQTFDEEISRELARARAHLVCWSMQSVGSRWVRAEAHIGAGRNVLVPVFLEPCAPPPPFNLDHTVDLRDWQGQADHEGWIKVLARIGQLTGRGAALHRWEQLRDAVDTKGLRAFIKDFHSDPLSLPARRRAYEVELADARKRLLSELALSENEGLVDSESILRAELDAAHKAREAMRLQSADEKGELEREVQTAMAAKAAAESEVQSLRQEVSRLEAKHSERAHELNELSTSLTRELREALVAKAEAEAQVKTLRAEKETLEKPQAARGDTVGRPSDREADARLDPATAHTDSFPRSRSTDKVYSRTWPGEQEVSSPSSNSKPRPSFGAPRRNWEMIWFVVILAAALFLSLILGAKGF